MSELKITEQTETQLKLQLIPIDIWLSGLISVIAGIFLTCIMLPTIVEYPKSFLGLVGSLMLVGVGIFLLLGSGHIVTCTFDKACKQMILELCGDREREVFECSISQIAAVLIEPGPKLTYRIRLQLVSNASVPLTSFYTQNLNAKRKLAIAIAQFLNLNTRHLLFPETVSFKLGHQEQTQRDREIAKIQDAIPANPDDIKSYCELARLLDLQGQREDAVMVLKQAIDLSVKTRAHFQQREQIAGKILDWSRL